MDERRPDARGVVRAGLNDGAPAALPRARRALAVFAHPDDESFGLGAILGGLVETGSTVSALCFTHGEASSLGADGHLRETRAEELAAAAASLGVGVADLLEYPDGALASVPVAELADHVVAVARACDADLVIVFDEGGITGHPDHAHATAAALAGAARLDLDVLAWAIPDDVAVALNGEFGTAFAGRPTADVDLTVAVDRARQRRAIACHRSQATDNPVLWRRLDLMGSTESLRWLRRAEPAGRAGR